MASDFPYTEKQQRWWFANLDDQRDEAVPRDKSNIWTNQSQGFRDRINALAERKEAELRMAASGARIQVRPSTYRDRAGFSIVGRNAMGHRVRIFTTTRLSAERIRNRVLQGLEVRVEDFRG